MSANAAKQRAGAFIVTKEHRRFCEFANAVRKYRYIGLCYGPAGVGKTLSAKRYAHWDIVEPLVQSWGPRSPADTRVYAAAARARTMFYTPSVGETPRQLREELSLLISRTGICIEQHLHRDTAAANPRQLYSEYVEMMIIDEAERLTAIALESVRDLFDRTGIGVVLIGMPGIEKRLSRYEQLYSRVGFGVSSRNGKNRTLSPDRC